ncbi:hypothetical protein Echvi_0419 [Echinicola vietnamensis DSM 17526]|uniref:Uncharacterized protein n=2 Tax=Echinicola TaxID=390846 RepID=L0FVC4_ECHVK|nr:hypothetical protein Echvi_0419 [Echinicola vietnamensis DSM 17526]
MLIEFDIKEKKEKCTKVVSLHSYREKELGKDYLEAILSKKSF